MSDHPAVARVWAALTPAARRVLERELPPADLRTLLLDLARTRSGEVTTAQLLRQWRDDRFVRPASVDVRAVHRVEGRLWELLPEDVAGLELAPVTPWGTCTTVAPGDQNRIVSTVRGTEVISDATNVLAIEAAHRRRHGGPEVIGLAASHRVLRAQAYAGGSAHLRLFHLVSSARDRGSSATEIAMLITHIGYWQRVLGALVEAGTSRVALTALDDRDGARIVEAVLAGVADVVTATGVPVVVDAERTRGRGYYRAVALRLVVELDGEDLELGDGGLTDWTARLTSDAKERCLISCVAIERLAELGDPPAAAVRLR